MCCLTWGARQMSYSAEPRYQIQICGAQYKSSALLRKDREFQYGDLSELVTLCDSTGHLPVVLVQWW